MSAPIPSTIAQLLFRELPPLNFARIVGDLSAALDPRRSGSAGLRWDHDDVAIFDRQGSRILLAWADDLRGEVRGCLTISVGRGAGTAPCDQVCLNQRAVCGMIADRIASRFPGARIVWHATERLVDAELVDRMTDSAAALTVPQGPVRDDRPATEGGTDQVARLLTRLERELGHRPRASVRTDGRSVVPRRRRAPVPVQAAPIPAFASAEDGIDIANDRPDLPAPMTDRAEAVLRALDADPEAADRPSTALRLSAHALNASLMIVALPVGAAMMTYTLIRGENLTASARMLAVMGMAAGALQFAGIESPLMLI